jgi:hypothetical protein
MNLKEMKVGQTKIAAALAPLAYMKDAENQLTKEGFQIFSKSLSASGRKEMYQHEAENRLMEQHGKEFFHKMPKHEQDEYLQLFPKSRFATKGH